MMRKRALLLSLAVLCAAAYAAKTQRSPDQRILHALNRLTFGPRPGDIDRVKQMGLDRWIDQQLHPERIAENPVLAAKLQPLDSLRMSAAEMAANYPPPQLVKAMVDGRLPLPTDPERRMMIQKLVERYRNKQGKEAATEVAPDVQQILTPEQARTLRNGAPEEKIAILRALPEEKQFELLQALPPGVRRQLFAIAPPDLRRSISKIAGPQQVVAQDLAEGKLYRAVYSNRQLEEVLTDFWFNHFNVYLDKGADRYLVTSYERDAIRPHVLGKFEDMLKATAQSPAMLFYLDNWQSVDPGAAERLRATMARRRKAGPPKLAGKKGQRGLNENYGRELLELHTLGVDGGYTQKDVTEVARCFTGWTIRDPRRGGGFEFNQRVHDPGEKTVLGVKIPAGGGIEDGYKVLDIVAHHPSTARFIARKLAVRFVADDPPQKLIDRMAKTFTASNGDLREVLKSMLSAPEFWSQNAWRVKMKSPLEMVASALRAVDADVDFANGLAMQLTKLGQPLYRKQEPTGYSNSGEEWVNTAALLARMNFAVALTANKMPGVTVDTSKIDERLLPSQVPAQEGATPQLMAGLKLGSPEFQRR